MLLRGEHVTTVAVGDVREVVVDVDAGAAVLLAGRGPDVTVQATRSWLVGVPVTRHDVDTGTSAGTVRVGVVPDPASPRLLYAHSSAGDVTIDRG